MGYESKLFVISQRFDNSGKVFWNQIIATYEFCKLGTTFNYGLFDKPLEGKLLIGENEETDADRYDEKLKYCNEFQLLIDEFEKEYLFNKYRRIPPFVALLKGFLEMKDEFDNLIVVHYGH